MENNENGNVIVNHTDEGIVLTYLQDDVESGERLRQFREKRGYTQSDFGEKIGYRDSYINQMEKGEKPISKKVEQKLLREFGMDIEWLRYGIFDEICEFTQTAALEHDSFLLKFGHMDLSFYVGLCRVYPFF